MILENSLEFRLSGGSSNNDIDLSLGGTISSFSIPDSGRLFTSVGINTPPEYKCFYIINVGSEIIRNCKLYQSNRVDLESVDLILFSVNNLGLNQEAETINTRFSEPTNQIFNRHKRQETALRLGDIAPQEFIGIWIKRIINKAIGPHNSGIRLIVTCKG